MKNVIYIIIVIISLTACSEDLSEFRNQIELLKSNNAKEQQRIEEEKKRQKEKEKEAEDLKELLDSLKNTKNDTTKIPINQDIEININLPVVEITTDRRQEISSNKDYINAYFVLKEISTNGDTINSVEENLQIKGRGMTTWFDFPKKPYRLKFAKKISLFGLHEDKSWVLLANYADKSMLRNKLAFILGKMSNLDWTPSSFFVEVILNGEYIGTYQLCEKLKVSSHRVNVGNDGFLLEIDQRAPILGEVNFKIGHIENPIKFRDPDVSYNDDNYIYAHNFIAKVDEVLFSDNYSDPQEGWQKYMDMDSFVDWYIINELAKNNDAVFYSSCYMNFKRDGKLKMGPIWDFDLAFGNINYNDSYQTSGFRIKKVAWYSRLFNDPAFVKRLKERFQYFYNHRDDIMKSINNEAAALREASQNNEDRWHTFYNYTWPNYDIWGNYCNEVQYMKEWLSDRFNWMKSELDNMNIYQ